MLRVPSDVLVAVMNADIELEKKKRARVGDEHPINVEKIKRGLGCLPICEVEIDPPMLYGQIVIRHRIPAHERTYTVVDRWGFVTRTEKQVFAQEMVAQTAFDPYILDHYRGEAEDIARELIKQLRYKWNASWPHHA